MTRQDDSNEKTNYRKDTFLDWAEEHLKRIGELTFTPEATATAPGYGSHLRVTQKTSVFSLLDTLARAFQAGGQGKGRHAFIRLVEENGNWPDGKRVSALHLARALAVHSQTSQAPAWDNLKVFLDEKYKWLNGIDACERDIGADPDKSDVQVYWPSGQNLYAGRRKWCLTHFKHSSLLYDYRSCLVHESREQTFSQEKQWDFKPTYMTVGVRGSDDLSEYHLVYPLGFLILLAKDCIAAFRNADHDPYKNFGFGPYILQELNEPQV